MRTFVGILLFGGGAIASAMAIHGCASMPPEDCASRNRCVPLGDDASDANEDQTVADGADGQPTGDAPDGGPGGGSGDASDGSNDAGDGFDGFTCDPMKSPRDAPCVVSDAYGVFVSSSGRDTATGGMGDPLRTIEEGIARAIQVGKSRVYVCEGAYAGPIGVSSPVGLYGALACDAGWSYREGGVAQAFGAPNEIVLTVSNVSAPIAIEDMAFIAANASGQDDAGNGMSSLAALVNASTVTFRRCTFTAGRGSDGANGATGSNYTGATAPSGQAGDDAGNGGEGGSITCVDGTRSYGGNGGSANAVSATMGGDGGASPMPAVNPPVDGLGGQGSALFCTGSGHPGADGVAILSAAATTMFGALLPTGWTPSVGSPGLSGNPGQGGGGGGGVVAAPPRGGGGGGAGGCGGSGASAGGGGGSSIGLGCIASRVTLDSCTVVALGAGGGGRGGDGQPGQVGGGFAAAMGCPGGQGGNGAGGGAGGGGTGGISVCLVLRNSSAIGLPACTTGDAGLPGMGGTGGVGGMNGNDGSAGLPGVSQPQLSLP